MYSFLSSDPTRTCEVGLADKLLEPQPGEPAFITRYLVSRKAKALRAFADEIDGRALTAEQVETLYSTLREHVVGWRNVSLDGATLTFDPARLEDLLSDAEAIRLLWRIIRANELQPVTQKNSASPSPISTDSSATAPAHTAPTPQP